MTNEQRFLLYIIGQVLNTQIVRWKTEFESLSWESVFRQAEYHQVTNFLISDYLDDDDFATVKSDPRLFNAAVHIIRQNEIQQYSWEEVQKTIEAAGVDCVPMKGIVTKDYYPLPKLRCMCDLDLLYKEEQDAEMKQTMTKLGYGNHSQGIKHDHFTNDFGVHVEMHREMVEAGTAYRKYYQGIWNRVIQMEGFRHIYRLTPEDEYIFTVVHMKEHVIHGEATFKMVMDIYVMRKQLNLEQSYVEKELSSIGLNEFENNVRELGQKWFEADASIQAEDSLFGLSEYILGNSSYGNQSDHVANFAYEARGSKVRYFLYAAFPSLSRMQSVFPWLRKYSILLPVAWIMFQTQKPVDCDTWHSEQMM